MSNNYYYGLPALVKLSAAVPAIRYKSGAKQGTNLQRAFHFYPASTELCYSFQRNIIREDLNQVVSIDELSVEAF